MRRFLVLALLCLMVPGIAEVAENLWQLAATGHGAHLTADVAQGAEARLTALPDRGGAPAGSRDEHGCSGTFHLCTCCHTAPVHTAAVPTTPEPHLARLLGAEAGPGFSSPVLDSLDRPPKA